MRALIVVALLLAGCAAPPSSTVPPDVVTVTSPGDYGNGTAGAHLHDYWGGSDRRPVVDADGVATGPGFASGDEVVLATFRPEPGAVVPQGAGAVEVTWSWQTDALDTFSRPQLWLKTAATSATQWVADIENGVTVNVTSTNSDNDLPHQRLSAWIFELRAANGDLGWVRFKGAVALEVQAVRGLDIPLYPGHPDAWQGRTELPLLEAAGSDIYLQDPGDGGCDGMDCQEILVPEAGAIVPEDASFVEARLIQGPSPTRFVLSYHGSDSRTFERLEPATADGEVEVYEIPVQGNGDGPYATTSQWEFALAIDEPVADGAIVQDYSIVIRVLRA